MTREESHRILAQTPAEMMRQQGLNRLLQYVGCVGVMVQSLLGVYVGLCLMMVWMGNKHMPHRSFHTWILTLCAINLVANGVVIIFILFMISSTAANRPFNVLVALAFWTLTGAFSVAGSWVVYSYRSHDPQSLQLFETILLVVTMAYIVVYLVLPSAIIYKNNRSAGSVD